MRRDRRRLFLPCSFSKVTSLLLATSSHDYSGLFQIFYPQWTLVILFPSIIILALRWWVVPSVANLSERHPLLFVLIMLLTPLLSGLYNVFIVLFRKTKETSFFCFLLLKHFNLYRSYVRLKGVHDGDLFWPWD